MCAELRPAQPHTAGVNACCPRQVLQFSPLHRCWIAPLNARSISQASVRAPGLQVPACQLMHWMLLLLLLLAAAVVAYYSA
jgi:hypothetical protein